MIIAKYKRCSTDNQELFLQDEVLEKWISRYKEDNPNTDIEVLNFEDFAVSGKTKERTSLVNMMDHVDRGKIKLVIFTKLDRLGRSLQDLLNITDQFEKRDVNFVAIEQNLDTSTAQGKLLFHIIGAFAEFERSLIRERMEAGRQRALVNGSKSGKPMHRPKIQLDEDGILAKYDRGMSIGAIAKFYKVSITPIRRVLKKRIEDKKRKMFLELKKRFDE